MSSVPLSKLVAMSSQLRDTRDLMKRVLAEKWPERFAEYSAEIRKLMVAQKNDNALAVVLPVAKAMEAAGDSPLTLLAVAVEMCEPTT